MWYWVIKCSSQSQTQIVWDLRFLWWWGWWWCSGFWRHVDLSVDSGVLEKHTLHLQGWSGDVGSGGIYIGLEEGKAEGVGQSGTKHGPELSPPHSSSLIGPLLNVPFF
jgi:hypothetical protein